MTDYVLDRLVEAVVYGAGAERSRGRLNGSVGLPCSQNAHDQNVLVRCAQSKADRSVQLLWGKSYKTAMDWQSIQQTVQSCRRCEAESVAYLRVPCKEKRKPIYEPIRPIRLYFVSVAPPWGGAYFWDESKRDAVREGLFRALSAALGEEISTCRQFRDMGFFLTPAVKCPSMKDNRDHNKPQRGAVRNCADFLRDELFASEAERVLALGKVPFKTLCKIFNIRKPPQESAEFRKQIWWVQSGARKIPLSGTYFPGNNRHKGFSAIVQDIDRILKLFPKAQ